VANLIGECASIHSVIMRETATAGKFEIYRNAIRDAPKQIG
jgi:hypothetical protein